MNNTVTDKWGMIVGYRCDVCSGVFPKMWGTVCNKCREKRKGALYNSVDIEKIKNETRRLQLHEIVEWWRQITIVGDAGVEHYYNLVLEELHRRIKLLEEKK